MTNTHKQAIDAAEELCRRFEGVSLVPYLCPAGVPTQGFGTTCRPDGTPIELGDPPITLEIAETWLRHELDEKAVAVVKACPSLGDAGNERRLAACISFAYNLGTGAFRSSTLCKRLNSGDIESARAEMQKWVWAKGVKLAGLERRRKTEAAML